MGDWEHIFRNTGKVFLKPQEDMHKLAKFLKKEKVKRILDLGCGSGRHTVLLSGAGFDVYATDISEEGLKLTKRWLNDLKLKAKLKKSSCYKKFPFKDNFFDAVISTQVIHHNYIDKIRFCISEIERVLKPNGILFVTVSFSKYKRRATKFKNPEPRLYIPLDGEEKGLPHYIYTEKELLKDFNHFKVLDFHKDKGAHYCLLGKLKSNF